MVEPSRSLVQIAVYDHANQHVGNAKVAIRALEPKNAKPVALSYVKGSGTFRIERSSPGFYLATVTPPSPFEPEQRQIQVHPAGADELFVVCPSAFPRSIVARCGFRSGRRGR